MRKEKLSYHETARQFEISDNKIIAAWERIYLREGPEGLYIERRGRACTIGGTRKGRPPKPDKKVEEDLIAENQRLRADQTFPKISRPQPARQWFYDTGRRRCNHFCKRNFVTDYWRLKSKPYPYECIPCGYGWYITFRYKGFY
jgi:hypothetical protein